MSLSYHCKDFNIHQLSNLGRKTLILFWKQCDRLTSSLSADLHGV